MSYSLIVMTAKTEEEARRLARMLVEARLAAAANVLPGARSLYWWDGEVQDAAEAVVLLKTRRDLVDRAVARIKAAHGYLCPSIVALPIGGGNPDYLDWIDRETTGS